jgi:SPP1 gp7 family putative phage head morphogenesis protein
VSTIFRTNLENAYSAGRHAIYTAPAVKEARPYLRFDAIGDERTCEECSALDGVIRPTDEWTNLTPPLHFNDRCILTPLSPEEAEDEGVSDGLPPVEADEGFGGAPSEEGTDWKPDLSDYSMEIADVLRERLR